MESEEDLVSEGGQGSKASRDCENQMPGLVKCGIPNSHSNKGGGGSEYYVRAYGAGFRS
jgi:hypothetical protein